MPMGGKWLLKEGGWVCLQFSIIPFTVLLLLWYFWLTARATSINRWSYFCERKAFFQYSKKTYFQGWAYFWEITVHIDLELGNTRKLASSRLLFFYVVHGKCVRPSLSISFASKNKRLEQYLTSLYLPRSRREWMRDSCDSWLADLRSKMAHMSSRRTGWHRVRISRASCWWSGVRVAFLERKEDEKNGSSKDGDDDYDKKKDFVSHVPHPFLLALFSTWFLFSQPLLELYYHNSWKGQLWLSDLPWPPQEGKNQGEDVLVCSKHFQEQRAEFSFWVIFLVCSKHSFCFIHPDIIIIEHVGLHCWCSRSSGICRGNTDVREIF